MMALHDNFEATQASLLHHISLPTLKAIVFELIFYENHCSTMKMKSPKMVVASDSPSARKPLFSHSPGQLPSKSVFC